MIIAGIIGRDGKMQTASLINSILSSKGVKVSLIDSGSLVELDSQQVKDYLRELNKNNVDILLIKINIFDVKKEVYDNLCFDIIIYSDKADELNEVNIESHTHLMRRIFSLMDEKGIIIVNADDSEIVQFLHGLKNYIITYGFNPKASITASSIGDTVSKDGFICCQQRTISAKNGNLIEPQEYKIDLKANKFNANNVLAAVTFAIVNDVDLN